MLRLLIRSSWNSRGTKNNRSSLLLTFLAYTLQLDLSKTAACVKRRFDPLSWTPCPAKKIFSRELTGPGRNRACSTNGSDCGENHPQHHWYVQGSHNLTLFVRLCTPRRCRDEESAIGKTEEIIEKIICCDFRTENGIDKAKTIIGRALKEQDKDTRYACADAVIFGFLCAPCVCLKCYWQA